MKLFQIALSLFNIFAISVALVPKNVEIVMKQYVEPSTGDLQQGVYEKRYNYLKEGEKYPEPRESLFELKSLESIETELTGAADRIVADYYKDQEPKPKSGDFKLKADEVAEFTVTYTGLTVEDLSYLLKKQPNAKRISGKVEIGPKTDFEGRAAAAAAEPPSDLNVAVPRPNTATVAVTGAEAVDKGSPRRNSVSELQVPPLYKSSYFNHDEFSATGKTTHFREKGEKVVHKAQ